MSQETDVAEQTCAHPRCDRSPALDPPYCCVPCEVNAAGPGPEHLHSVTCEQAQADYGDPSQVRAYRDRSGMGETKCVDAGNVRVWTWSHAMDGPIPPEAERLFEALESWVRPAGKPS